jgi:hypothetical protein
MFHFRPRTWDSRAASVLETVGSPQRVRLRPAQPTKLAQTSSAKLTKAKLGFPDKTISDKAGPS